MEPAKNLYKRLRTEIGGWQLPSFIGFSNCKCIQMDLPINEPFEEQVSEDHIDDDKGLRWKLLARSNDEAGTDKRISVYLYVNMEPDDDGSHWRCEAEVKMKILTRSPTYLNLIIHDKNLTWTRESSVIGFENWIDPSNKDLKANFVNNNGHITILAEFLPREYNGFYTPVQKNMRSMLYDDDVKFYDLELIPKDADGSNGQPAKCHASVFVTFGKSPILQEIVKKQWEENARPVRIETDLTPQAIKALLEFVYFQEDFDISHSNSAGIAYDLIKFAVKNRMSKLINNCIQILCSKFKENADSVCTAMALDLYRLVARNDNLNKISQNQTENGSGSGGDGDDDNENDDDGDDNENDDDGDDNEHVGVLTHIQCYTLKKGVVDILKSRNLKGTPLLKNFMKNDYKVGVMLVKDVL